MIETSSIPFGNLRQSSAIFGNLRKMLENVQKMFGNVRQAFATILENLRSSSESGRKSSENRQKRRHQHVYITIKIPLTSKLDSACGLVQFWLSSEFFSSNYFQIGQHVVLLHIQILDFRKGALQ